MPQYLLPCLCSALTASTVVPRAAAFRTALRIPLQLVRTVPRNQASIRPLSQSWTSRTPSFPVSPTLRLRLRGGGLNSMATTSTPATQAAPVEKFRKDYKVPDYSIQTVELTFKIFNGHTQVLLYFGSQFCFLSASAIDLNAGMSPPFVGSFFLEDQEEVRCWFLRPTPAGQ